MGAERSDRRWRVVFVPAIIAGGEMEVFLCAGYDGTPLVVDKGHVYVPAPWVAREFPRAKETAEKIERQVKTSVLDMRGPATVEVES